MRPIKFRGKRVDNGEWVYGDLLTAQGDISIYDHETDSLPRVIPETVGQYYGKDDKGNEMYEHDVCEVPNWNPSVHGIFFNREGFCMGYAECYCYLDCKYLEKGYLIGNLHDNEDLRKKVLNPEIEKELAKFYGITK